MNTAYDSIAKGYEDWVIPQQIAGDYYAAVADAILSEINGVGIALDLGCGPGGCSLALARTGNGVIALDYSAEMLKLLKGHGSKEPELRLLCLHADAHRIPLQPHSVNVCLCFQSFHFVEDPELVLQEISRVLRFDGILVVNGPSEREGSSLAADANRFYRESIEASGCVPKRPPGWTTREIREKLTETLSLTKEVAIANGPFEFIGPSAFQYFRLKNRYTYYQMFVNELSHCKAVAYMTDKLRELYGDDFKDREERFVWQEKLSIYRLTNGCTGFSTRCAP